MDEQDYKNLIAIYQQKAQDFFNQTVAAETREMKYKQQAEVYANRVTELQKQLSAAIDLSHQRSLSNHVQASGDEREVARLKCLTLPHSGDWLNCPPIASPNSL